MKRFSFKLTLLSSVIFLTRIHIHRRSGVHFSVKPQLETVVRKKSGFLVRKKSLPENSSWIHARVNLFANTFSRILSTPRAKHSSARYPPLSTRELSAAPFLRLSTRLLSSSSFAHRPARSRLPLRTRIFCGRELACSRVLCSSRPHERMIASLIDKLATRKCYGNTISVGERSTLINTFRVPHS